MNRRKKIIAFAMIRGEKMEYRLPNSNDEKSITQFLKEYFLNEEILFLRS